MKLNEKCPEILLRLKGQIFNSSIFPNRKTFTTYGATFLVGCDSDRFYDAMFQLEEKDLQAPLNYCKRTKRKPNEGIKYLASSSFLDLYLNTDFSDEQQYKTFLSKSNKWNFFCK